MAHGDKTSEPCASGALLGAATSRWGPKQKCQISDMSFICHMYSIANFRNLPMDAVVVFIYPFASHEMGLPVFYGTSADRHVASFRSRASFRRPGSGPGLGPV